MTLNFKALRLVFSKNNSKFYVVVVLSPENITNKSGKKYTRKLHVP